MQFDQAGRKWLLIKIAPVEKLQAGRRGGRATWSSTGSAALSRVIDPPAFETAIGPRPKCGRQRVAGLVVPDRVVSDRPVLLRSMWLSARRRGRSVGAAPSRRAMCLASSASIIRLRLLSHPRKCTSSRHRVMSQDVLPMPCTSDCGIAAGSPEIFSTVVTRPQCRAGPRLEGTLPLHVEFPRCGEPRVEIYPFAAVLPTGLGERMDEHDSRIA